MTDLLAQGAPSSDASDQGRARIRPDLSCARRMKVALLTGGQDKPYALGLSSALIGQGLSLDFIGSDYVDAPELHDNPQVVFLNLRGDPRRDATLLSKALRILNYYVRLARYAAMAEPKVFHILWNNKFEFFDRVALMLYYRLLGRRLALTAHNVNAAVRDSKDTWLNRLSLKIQYHLAHHIFVHTEKMKAELLTGFAVPSKRVTVIPFGINDTLPKTSLTGTEARQALGLSPGHKTLLFFGNIAPYKGLEYLVAAFAALAEKDASVRLIIAGAVGAGAVGNCAQYWQNIEQAIKASRARNQVVQKIEYIPDAKAEIYFKAADALVLPYTHIFQSGVLFLGYSFGLPVIASDVGSLKEDIVDGQTGFTCRARDAADLARTIEQYFSSELYRNLATRRPDIRNYARDKFSWARVAEMTIQVYSALSQN